jgi:hypothetical protein
MQRASKLSKLLSYISIVTTTMKSFATLAVAIALITISTGVSAKDPSSKVQGQVIVEEGKCNCGVMQASDTTKVSVR